MTDSGILCIVTDSEIVLYDITGTPVGLPIHSYEIGGLVTMHHDIGGRTKIVCMLDNGISILDIDVRNGDGLKDIQHKLTVRMESHNRPSGGPRSAIVPFLGPAWHSFDGEPDQRTMAIATLHRDDTPLADESLVVHSTTLPVAMANEPGIGRFVVLRNTRRGNYYINSYQLMVTS